MFIDFYNYFYITSFSSETDFFPPLVFIQVFLYWLDLNFLKVYNIYFKILHIGILSLPFITFPWVVEIGPFIAVSKSSDFRIQLFHITHLLAILF